jgi:hypothetical protein
VSSTNTYWQEKCAHLSKLLDAREAELQIARDNVSSWSDLLAERDRLENTLRRLMADIERSLPRAAVQQKDPPVPEHLFKQGYRRGKEPG